MVSFSKPLTQEEIVQQDRRLQQLVVFFWLFNRRQIGGDPVLGRIEILGKCLHRFLSGQPKQYKNEVLKLADTIGYDGPKKNIKQRFGKSLSQLTNIDWLKTFRFTGNSRSVPLVLHTER